jgi:Uma2 family endonuclease
MPAKRRHHRFTLEQYYEWELDHPEKFEYVDGEILAMSGADVPHNIVASNTLALLHPHFRGRCLVFGSDQRVATGDGLHTYPDLSVVCGRMELSRYKGTGTLHNPCLLVEVLSPSTRDYDLGEKLERYQTIPALRDVLLIDSEAIDVRHVRRTEEGWETRRFRDLADAFDVGDLRLALSDIYRDLPE